MALHTMHAPLARRPRHVTAGALALLVAVGVASVVPAHGVVRAADAGILLDAGGAWTTASTVSLTITTSDGSTPTEVRIANDGATTAGVLDTGETIPWSASITWSLDAAPCPCGDGERTVWAQWRTGDGPWSAVTSDTIIVDRTGPTGTVLIDGGAATMGDPWGWSHSAYTFPTVTLTLDVSDAGPALPPIAWAVSRDGTTWEQHELAAYGTSQVTYELIRSDNVDEGTKTVWVKWLDGLGNWSAPVTDTIELKYDDAGRVIVGDGGGYIDTPIVKVRVPVDVMPPEGVASVWLSSNYLGCGNQPYACHAKKFTWSPGMVISWDLRDPDYLGSTQLGGGKRVVAWFVSATGRVSQSAQQWFVLDRAAPVTGAPRPVFVVNSVIEDTSTASRVTAKVRWSAGGTGSPVAATRLQRSANGGTWKTVDLATRTSTAANVSLAQRASYRFRARTLDKAGNWSSWKSGSAFAVVARQQSADAITYSGGWRTVARADASGGSLVRARVKGAKASLQFTGRGVAVVAPRSTTGGAFNAYVDGRFVKTVYLYGSSYQPRRVVFTASWASSGTHRISLVKKWDNPDAPVSLDAIIVIK